MSSLSSLVSQLEADVPALNSVPSEAQYTQAVKDAIADLGRRAPMQKITTLAVVNGTAAYDLPADFVKLIRLSSLSSSLGVLVTSAGLVPVSSRSCERTLIAGGRITLHPTPAYTLDRELWYTAAYVLDDDGDTYADLSEDRAQIALLKARSLALSLQANKAAGEAWKHQLGPEQVDKTAQAAALRTQASALETQYQAAILTLNGPIGMRG